MSPAVAAETMWQSAAGEHAADLAVSDRLRKVQIRSPSTKDTYIYIYIYYAKKFKAGVKKYVYTKNDFINTNDCLF